MPPNDLGTPIKIWYKPLPSFPLVKWPIVEIGFDQIQQRLLALVDSGSSNSIFHPELAKVLGFDRKMTGSKLQSGKSVSGNYQSWAIPKPLNVEIYGYPFSFRFDVVDNPDLIWPCILGEDSIFEVARLDFQKFKGYFEIKFRKDIN